MIMINTTLFLHHPTGPSAVSAADVRDHLARLSAAGVGYRRAAVLAGVPVDFVRGVLFGRRRAPGRPAALPLLVPRDKAALILAVDLNPEAGALVSARGARRRVQALIVAGWSQAKIAERLGMSIKVFGRVLRQDMVRAGTHFAIANLFEDLWDVAPPLETAYDRRAASHSRSYSQALGWKPALAWDDIDADDEPAPPDLEVAFDEIAVDLATSGYDVPLTRLERLSAIRLLHSYRLSDVEIAEILHLNDRTVWRIRHQFDMPGNYDLYGQLVTA